MALQQIFVRKLREALEAKNWTQSDLARALDMTPQSVGHYVHGRRSPGIELVEKFAAALDVEHPANLLDDQPLKILQPIGLTH